MLTTAAQVTTHSEQRSRKTIGFAKMLAASLLILGLTCNSVLAQGTWTKLTNNNPAGGSGSMLLLTDGTVVVQRGGCSKIWTKLTPDSGGNYINGTWSTIAPMSLERLYTGSVVMPNGKMFILGGEYTGPASSGTWDKTGEIYDPVSNTWTPSADFPRSSFGDGQAVLLPNGKILAGYLSGPETYLYDPATNTWAQSGSKLRNDRNNEETWVLLPNGEVLCYEIFTNIDTGPWSAQRYVTSTGTWVDAGNVPVQLSSSALGAELGPAGLLPDGRAIQIGANRNMALYTRSTNTWAAGPTLPAGLGADDTPGAVLPNGHFLFAVDTSTPNLFTPPTRLFDFNYANNSLTEVTPGGALGSELASRSAYVSRMLVLPNGHMLFTNGSGSIWDYAPSGSPQATWRPTITGVVKTGANYTLTGARLTGISEGANYGDDAGLSTNYPIIRLTGPGGVKYAKSSNWTPGVHFVGDNSLSTVKFTLPSGLADGQYQLATIASGIASTSAQVTIVGNVITNVVVSTGSGGGNVVTTYNATTKKLTLTGDVNANSVSVTYKPAATSPVTPEDRIIITGLNGTKVNNKTADQWYPHTGSLDFGAVMSDGNDSVYLIGVVASQVYLNLGNGNDQAGLQMCTVSKLYADGGTGTNTIVTTTSTIPPVGVNRVLKNIVLIP